MEKEDKSQIMNEKEQHLYNYNIDTVMIKILKGTQA